MSEATTIKALNKKKKTGGDGLKFVSLCTPYI